MLRRLLCRQHCFMKAPTKQHKTRFRFRLLRVLLNSCMGLSAVSIRTHTELLADVSRNKGTQRRLSLQSTEGLFHKTTNYSVMSSLLCIQSRELASSASVRTVACKRVRVSTTALFERCCLKLCPPARNPKHLRGSYLWKGSTMHGASSSNKAINVKATSQLVTVPTWQLFAAKSAGAEALSVTVKDLFC